MFCRGIENVPPILYCGNSTRLVYTLTPRVRQSGGGNGKPTSMSVTATTCTALFRRTLPSSRSCPAEEEWRNEGREQG